MATCLLQAASLL
jgi:hypothetical protein